jgi:ribonuclease BN (tRNA processing enzyme)
MLTSFLIGDEVVMDAGSMAGDLEMPQQACVRHILLTHSHLDHTGTLPFFVDNIFGMHEEPVSVYGPRETIDSVKGHLFNNDIWPDFSVLPSSASPVMRFCAIEPETPTRIGALTVTSVDVNHIVPTVGYLFEQDGVSVLFSGDTAPTERIWEIARAQDNLRAVFIEASFPNQLQNIADVSGHLTPRTFGSEYRKIGRDLPVYAYHLKPRFYDELCAELKGLGLPDFHIAEQGKTYKFE